MAKRIPSNGQLHAAQYAIKPLLHPTMNAGYEFNRPFIDKVLDEWLSLAYVLI
jgi:hypothetical protein